MKRVIIGLSGGVDSSVSALLLKKAGYEVIGVTFSVSEKWKENNISFSEKIASQLKIKHEIISVKEDFNEKIISYYLKNLNTKQTPSCCPICNAIVKYKVLSDFAKTYDAGFISTGHYADKVVIDNIPILKKTANIRKDQTYMLYRLDTNIIKKLIFPLAEYSKTEIRNIAKENNLITFDRPDSQGLCFQEKGYIEFIKENIGNEIKKGFFVDEKGNILGEHEGHQYYTIGQRRGLSINLGKPYFVIDKNVDENKVILGEHKKLFSNKIILKDFVINPYYKSKIENIIFTARPRFSSSGHPAKVRIANNSPEIFFQEPNPESSLGQHIVLYDDDKVAGGGIIQKVSLM